MRKLIFLLLLVILGFKLNAQIPQNEFERLYNQLMEHLSNENWSRADSLTTILLTNLHKVDSMEHEKQVLRYISIYSTAGLMNENLINKDDAIKKVTQYKGLRLVMPAHPLNNKCYVNCTHLDSDIKNTFFSAVNNAHGTQIFSFEYVKMKEPIDEKYIKTIEGKNIALSGLLESIAVEGNMLPRFKMHFTDGEMEIME